MNQTWDLQVYDDDTDSFDGGASVASSDWANLSSTSEDRLSVKDVANWGELWGLWSTNQRVSTVTAENITIDHDVYQIISNIFRPSRHIPNLRFYTQPAEQHPCSKNLQEHLADIAKNSPGLLEEADAGLFSSNEPGHFLALATAAMEIHETALSIFQHESMRFYDDVWATQVHDALLGRCAQGRLLGKSPSWTLPPLQLDISENYTISQLLDVCSVKPHGAIPILSEDEEQTFEPFFSAVFSTRSQMALHQGDVPEHLALHAFSIMATSALLAPLAELGINTPIFGVMCDRNIVRFHVNWNAVSLNSQHTGIVSLPLPRIDVPSEAVSFRELDLTRPDDALRVAFMLDAMHTYTHHVLAPAVRASVKNTLSSDKLPLSQGEITSEEKVAAWMHYDNQDTIIRSSFD